MTAAISHTIYGATNPFVHGAMRFAARPMWQSLTRSYDHGDKPHNLEGDHLCLTRNENAICGAINVAISGEIIIIIVINKTICNTIN